MGVRIGANCRLYRSGNSDFASIVDEITLARDVTLTMTLDEADATIRGSNGFKMTEPTLIGLSIDFEIVRDNGHADFLALQNMALNRANQFFAVATGNIGTTGETYIKFDGKVFKFDESQALADISKVSVNIKPCYSSNLPTFVQV